MASQEEDGNNPRRRRRSIEEYDDDIASNASSQGSIFGNSGNNNNNSSSRAARLAQRVAQRRRQAAAAAARLHLADDDDDEEDGALDMGEDPEMQGDQEEDGVDGDNSAADPEAEEDEGEDLLENAQRDYQRIAALDTYGTEGLDDRDFDAMAEDERRAAEAAMARRDRRNDGFYDSLLQGQEDGEGENEEDRMARRAVFARRQRGDGDDAMSQSSLVSDEEEEEDLDGDDPLNLEAFDVPLREWIAQDRTRREIQRKFRAFLKHFTDDASDDNNDADGRRRNKRGRGLYEAKIRAMCAQNRSALTVSYMHLMRAEPVLAYWLADAPSSMLLVLNEAATRHVVAHFPSYRAICSEIRVRLSHLPILDSLRDLRRSHLNGLVRVHGVVTRRSAVSPQLLLAYYACTSCKKHTVGPFRVPDQQQQQGESSEAVAALMPDSCPNCEYPRYRLHPTLSLYRNVQRVNLQETPGSVPPGRVPRTKQVLLSDDLIDAAAPGEQVEITGVYEHTFDAVHTLRGGCPVFGTYIRANHVATKGGGANGSDPTNLTEYDVRRILELAKDPRIGERLVKSLAPSIFGHDFCKMALAMSLFGGVAKQSDPTARGNGNGGGHQHRIRGDVNVLLLGDPGTAKSQLLRYAEQTAPRSVYSTGKGASAVGLTASVHKDPITREWTLEGGALVLADQGVCMIDEFDKMNEQDRTSIHEAMEQQTISISKAGIVTSLQARCSVIAAANPIGGRYDSSNTLADNVELTDPILQRFDILCVLQDVVDPVADERLAKFVTGSHMRSVPTSSRRDGDGVTDSSAPQVESVGDGSKDNDLIPQELLRKYIQYARVNVRPALRGNAFDREKVASLYVALRRESAASGGVPIAVRHVESMMRMAEAHARMHLRDYVRDDDMDASIRMMLESFIVAQKFSVRRALRRSFAKYMTSGEDRAHALLHILQDMFRKERMYQVIRLRQRNQSEDALESLEVPLDELQNRARERRIFDVSEFCRSEVFVEAGYHLDEGRGLISRQSA